MLYMQNLVRWAELLTARRLAQFIEEEQLKRRSPLIVTPLGQKAATKKPMPTRSRRIAAQPRWSTYHLQMGQGTPHKKNGHPVTCDTNFIRVQASIRRHLHSELDVLPSCNSRRVVSSDQQ
jgi:hypothetical protein